MTSSVALRVFAFVCFVLWVVLEAAKVVGGTFEAVLPVCGLALWVLSTLV